MRVTVPFGPRKIMGFVVQLKNETNLTKLKELHEVLDITPVLTEELLQLGKSVAKKTLSLYITVFQTMLPQVLKSQYTKDLVRETDEFLSPELEDLFAGRESIPFEEFTASSISYYYLQKQIEAGHITIYYHVKSRITKKSRQWSS